MANIIYYTSTRGGSDTTWLAQYYGAQTTTKFEILDSNGIPRESEEGVNFTYGWNGFFNSGTVTATFAFTSSGELASQATGLDVDVATRNSLLSVGTSSYNFEQYVLRGDDSILGSAGADLLMGSKGNDTINGGNGSDVLSFNNFGESVSVNLSTGLAITSYGTSHLSYIEDIEGSGYGDTLTGNAGNNQIQGFAGADTIDGGAGFDTAAYFDARSAVNVNLDTGVVIGGSGNDTLVSIERVIGSRFDDTFVGASANESFLGGFGNDSINGGGGVDTVEYGFVTSGVNVNLATGQASGAAGNDVISNVENISGSIFNDTLTGNSGANVLNGGAGIDTLTGGDGNDTYHVDNISDTVTETNAAQTTGGLDLVVSSVSYAIGANIEHLRLNSTSAINGTGNALNNTIYAGGGNNVMDGGIGIDTVSYTYAASGVKASLATTVAQATGGSGSDTLLNFEYLIGSNYNDVLTGNDDANMLNGGNGADILNGGIGNDLLTGGSGNDTLTGGLGADNFIFNSVLGIANIDKVTDFIVVDDTIRLENAVFTKLTTLGTLNSANFKIGSGAGDADDYICYNSSTGAVSYDADGSGTGAAVQFAIIGTGLSLTSADFYVI